MPTVSFIPILQPESCEHETCGPVTRRTTVLTGARLPAPGSGASGPPRYCRQSRALRNIQGSARQPDIVEKPGLRLDFVAREAIRFLGKEAEIKLEARNLLGQDYEEFQQSGDNRIDINSYKVGRSVSVGLSMTF